MVSFNNSAGNQIAFGQNGELAAGFDIINWVTFPNQSFDKVKVGRLDPQAPPDEAITINKDAIEWHSWFNQVRLGQPNSTYLNPSTVMQQWQLHPLEEFFFAEVSSG